LLKQGIFLSLLLVWAVLLLPLPAHALDSALNLPVTFIPQTSATGPNCTYSFVDTYDGTVLPGGTGSDPVPTGKSVTLKFYNNVWNSGTQSTVSTPTSLTTPVPCAGTYQLIFTIELQMTTDTTNLDILASVVDNVGTTLYPVANEPTTLILYPECNNTGYAGTPYCNIGWVSGSVQVQLPAGDQVYAPIVATHSAISTFSVIGGQFELFYLHQ
jgi:hypothetical protein